MWFPSLSAALRKTGATLNMEPMVASRSWLRFLHKQTFYLFFRVVDTVLFLCVRRPPLAAANRPGPLSLFAQFLRAFSPRSITMQWSYSCSVPNNVFHQHALPISIYPCENVS